MHTSTQDMPRKVSTARKSERPCVGQVVNNALGPSESLMGRETDCRLRRILYSRSCYVHTHTRRGGMQSQED